MFGRMLTVKMPASELSARMTAADFTPKEADRHQKQNVSLTQWLMSRWRSITKQYQGLA
jgi:hypothetical protein